MERIEKLLFAFFVFALLFIGFGSATIVNFYMFSCPDCKLECSLIPNCELECAKQSDCICYEKSCPELPLFMREAINIADAHYYEKDRYVCQHYAEALHRRLKADGYTDARYCIGIAKWCLREGKPEKDCWHGVVKIGDSIVIEATSGKIIPPKDVERDYDIRRCPR